MLAFITGPETGSFLVPITSLTFGIIGCIYAKEMIVRATAFLGAVYLSLGFIIMFLASLLSSIVLMIILFIVLTAGFTYGGYKT